MSVVACDAADADRLQLVVLGRGLHDERREQLLQDVAVPAQHQRGKFQEIVGDQIDLHAAVIAGQLNRVRTGLQTDDFVGR